MRISHSARRFLLFSFLSFGLASTSFAEVPHYAGPRNTIPRQVTTHPLGQLDASRQASTYENASCKSVRVVHHGHPGKGVDRIEGMSTRVRNRGWPVAMRIPFPDVARLLSCALLEVMPGVALHAHSDVTLIPLPLALKALDAVYR